MKADEVAAGEGDGSGVRGSVDVDSEVSKCVARLMAGWVSSGEEMSRLVTAYTAVMQHIKLPEPK